MGLRYLRTAGSGMSSVRTGRRSSVYCGEMESMDLVRNSSRCMAILEKDRAADLSTRIEAVRFDLNEDRNSDTGMLISGFMVSVSHMSDSPASVGLNCLWDGDSGWSRPQSSTSDSDSDFNRRSRLPERAGVDGWLVDSGDSRSMSNDGIESVDNDRKDESGAMVLLLPRLQLSASDSSGGLWRISQERGLVSDSDR